MKLFTVKAATGEVTIDLGRVSTVRRSLEDPSFSGKATLRVVVDGQDVGLLTDVESVVDEVYGKLMASWSGWATWRSALEADSPIAWGS